MTIITYYLIPFILVLGMLIFFHELGHFLVAKFYGVKVEKFALGFGPILLKKDMGETEYSIRFFPLGGFVKMLGEEDLNDDDPLDLSPEEEARAFNKKPVFQRIAIVAAGPIFNLVLAFLFFLGIYIVSGIKVMSTEIGQVRENSPAQKAGLEKGDLIIAIQGQPLNNWADIKGHVQSNGDKPVILTVQRGDRIIGISIIPETGILKNEFGEEIKTKLIGIISTGKMNSMEVGIFQAFEESLKETWKWTKLTCVLLGKIFQGKVPFNSIGGPILIGQMTGKLAQNSYLNLIPFTAIISVNLGIVNLFPIPILDGGVIIFLLLELLLGRPLGQKKREWAMKAGFFALIVLMLTITYNDLDRMNVFQKLFG